MLFAQTWRHFDTHLLYSHRFHVRVKQLEKLETVSPWNLNKEARSCSVPLAPPPLFINASLLCHYVYRTPMQASIYRDLGTVLWDLCGPIMSLSHYELARKKIIDLIEVRLASTPIFAFLPPPSLSTWAVCPRFIMCNKRKPNFWLSLLYFNIIISLWFCDAHYWLTPEFGYAVHPSSAVATLVSITVSVAETENKRRVRLRKLSCS